jgi:hypothetical protein
VQGVNPPGNKATPRWVLTKSEANHTTLSYNASVVKINNATNSMARFYNKNYFLWRKNALAYYNAGVVHSCKFKSRSRIDSGKILMALPYQYALVVHICHLYLVQIFKNYFKNFKICCSILAYSYPCTQNFSLPINEKHYCPFLLENLLEK